VNGFPSFNTNGTIPPSPGATPLATTAAASFARGRSSPASFAFAGTDSNPFSSLLNALNPIRPANAADDEGGGLPPALAQAVLQGLFDAATAKRLAEQQKVLQEAQDARRELFEVAQGRASSPALGAALEASGIPRPKGYAAHHIAAGGAERAEAARRILQKFNIGINDVSNGVFLPADRATQVDALDEKASDALRATDGPDLVLMIRKHVFQPAKLTGDWMFKLPQSRGRSAIYVTDPFADLIHASGLTGLEFKRVWPHS
jgi:hypothetical protein